ncbi:hypothetical protein CRUP_021458, partial [Coryphaenoides rupestris]
MRARRADARAAVHLVFRGISEQLDAFDMCVTGPGALRLPRLSWRRKLLQVLGDTKIPFLGPARRGLPAPGSLAPWPPELHGRVQAALCTLRTKGCLLRDLVRIRDRDVFTTVSRALLGQPGHTYRYLDTRLFAIPWHTEEGGAEVKGPAAATPDMRAACKALWELNSFFCTDGGRGPPGSVLKAEGVVKVEAAAVEDGGRRRRVQAQWDSQAQRGGGLGVPAEREGGTGESKHSDEWDLESKHSDEGCSGAQPGGHSWETESKHSTRRRASHLSKALNGAQTVCTDPAQFNVTLLNYMDPAAMRHLKEEPYYGMGKMAVGWHHDENLIAQSPVAVYSYSCHSDVGEGGEGASKDVSCWRIGLKVAWDIYTPGLTLPLQSGDCYYMR